MSDSKAEEIVAETLSSLGAIEVPAALEATIGRYHRHLMGLASSLLVGGHDVDTVRRSIETVFNSYKGELIDAIMTIRDANAISPNH